MSFSSNGGRRGSVSLTSKRRGSGTEKLESHVSYLLHLCDSIICAAQRSGGPFLFLHSIPSLAGMLALPYVDMSHLVDCTLSYMERALLTFESDIHLPRAYANNNNNTPAAAAALRYAAFRARQIASWHTSTHKHEEGPHAHEEQLKQVLERFEKLFTITPQRLRMITDRFVGVLEEGLQKTEQTVPMLPAYVFGWPTGDEVGSYLALDLGGTNLRVCHVVLKGQGKFEITQSKFRLTEEQKQCEGQKLFDFCADCLATFITDHFGDKGGEVILEEELALGFTFSYPMSQDRIDHGKLIRWTKGFGNPNTEGRDCAAMFRESLEKYKVPVKLVSIINDTTGTLIASNYVNHETRIACIFGTGCNAAYMEHVKAIPKIKDLGLPDEEDMAINCEYGAFDSFKHEHMAEIRTKYDEHIDMHSNKPHEQSYEKMIAGLYLGEIFRLCICDLIDEGVLFLGQNTYKLEKAYAFDTAFLSLIELDPTDELLTVTGLFTHFFGIDTTIEERQFFRKLAKLIGTRSARLSSCGIAALVTKMGYLEKGCGVGADGSLYSKYPGFADRLHEALEDIFGEKGKQIRTYQAEDGSGVGSAIIAAMTKARKEEGKYQHSDPYEKVFCRHSSPQIYLRLGNLSPMLPMLALFIAYNLLQVQRHGYRDGLALQTKVLRRVERVSCRRKVDSNTAVVVKCVTLSRPHACCTEMQASLSLRSLAFYRQLSSIVGGLAWQAQRCRLRAHTQKPAVRVGFADGSGRRFLRREFLSFCTTCVQVCRVSTFRAGRQVGDADGHPLEAYLFITLLRPESLIAIFLWKHASLHLASLPATVVRPTTHFKLNSGASIPSVGLGTWQSPKGEVRDAVCHALKSGYRHIDCAWGYQNEDEVGEGIKLSGVPREEIWITSKLFEFHHNHVRQACLDTLEKLGVEYLDLYLMHWNIAFVPEDVPEGQLPRNSKKDPATGKHLLDLETTENFVNVWKDLEALVDEGLVKNIGISNFSIRRTKELLKSCRIKPVTNQVELSFTFPQPELVAWLKSQDILPQAYSPLGSTGASQASLEVVDKIAKKHGVQGANVLISWQVARGCNPLPKSVTPSRIENNIKLIDLSEEELKSLEEGALAQTPKKVCDQSDLVVPSYDIFEANHPTNNDKVQAAQA
ncbi:hypothetical protein BCV70DRAFT_153874 [Testicularia cyperi]|uniref:hexokinase n=1 Tax=Testicularia cyperi TaxID=1882483 RepID=A0A317Y188_9BASI|nr:hypothetical protein BCV70DRAFT_153874 [Testicularia cyperi]